MCGSVGHLLAFEIPGCSAGLGGHSGLGWQPGLGGTFKFEIHNDILGGGDGRLVGDGRLTFEF